LGSLRSTFSIYYADNEGFLPRFGSGASNLNDLFLPKYIERIPVISIPTVSESIHAKSDWHFPGPAPDDNAWGPLQPFVWFTKTFTDPISGDAILTGLITVNCTPPDSSGKTWSPWLTSRPVVCDPSRFPVDKGFPNSLNKPPSSNQKRNRMDLNLR
jgi:hypothetical protein